MNAILPKNFLRCIRRYPPDKSGNGSEGRNYSRILSLAEGQKLRFKANQFPVDRFFSYQLYFRDHADELLSEEFRHAIDREFPLDVPRRHYARVANCAPLNRLLYVDLKLAVADNDLFKVNRMAEAHGIQVRYPFLDTHVGTTAGRIPADLKSKDGRSDIYSKAFQNLLPREILRKKKHGIWPAHGRVVETSPWV